MSFSTALSGLNAATADLNVRSNNIANVNTTGFKQSRAEFGDIFAVSAFGSTTKTAIGNGTILQNVAQEFSQGNLEFTGNALDLAITGEGFFAVAPELGASDVIYTRAGEFNINKDGYIVSNEGWFLRAFPVDSEGNVTALSMSATSPLQLPPTIGAPEATTAVGLEANLPSNADAIGIGGTPLVTGFNTSATPLSVTDFSLDQVSFEVDGNLVLLDANYLDLAGVVDEINAQLPANYLASLDGANNLVITSPDENAPVITNFNGDVDAGNAVIADFVNGTQTAGSPAVLGQIVAIDATDPDTYNFSTSATVFDSLGNEHVLTTYFQKISPDADDNGSPAGENQWQVSIYVDGADVVGGTAGTPFELASGLRVSFLPNGALDSVQPSPTEITFDVDGLLGFEWASGADGQVIEIGFDSTTQNAGPFNVSNLDVNGFTTGRLTGVDVSDDGLIRATYSNGQADPIGRIALGNFANPQALTKIGSTGWRETSDSGSVIAGEAATGSFGQIQAGALENSNVDLTKELVGLITAQRNFQANSKAIETNNAITQTIINLR